LLPIEIAKVRMKVRIKTPKSGDVLRSAQSSKRGFGVASTNEKALGLVAKGHCRFGDWFNPPRIP
jgi:hypothetical protein